MRFRDNLPASDRIEGSPWRESREREPRAGARALIQVVLLTTNNMRICQCVIPIRVQYRA